MTGSTPDPALTRWRKRRLALLGRVAREVFAILLAAHTPLKPYELLWRLQMARGKPAPPSTIYRALKALVGVGLAHRIDMIGAYVLCAEPSEPHAPAFLVCDQCGAAHEVQALRTRALLEQRIGASGFAVARMSFVLRGACAACREPER
jgi:Fur family transcriptional regulator, zinc uptake regulator